LICTKISVKLSWVGNIFNLHTLKTIKITPKNTMVDVIFLDHRDLKINKKNKNKGGREEG